MEKGNENKSKKQVPLRLSPTLYAELARWAEDDFRSLNGQIETECVKRRGGAKEIEKSNRSGGVL